MTNPKMFCIEIDASMKSLLIIIKEKLTKKDAEINLNHPVERVLGSLILINIFYEIVD